MADDDTEQRLQAHRAAFAVLAMVMEGRTPGAFDDIIEAISVFEVGARARNETTAYVSEFRELREGLESMRGHLPGEPDKPRPLRRSAKRS